MIHNAGILVGSNFLYYSVYNLEMDKNISYILSNLNVEIDSVTNLKLDIELYFRYKIDNKKCYFFTYTNYTSFKDYDTFIEELELCTDKNSIKTLISNYNIKTSKFHYIKKKTGDITNIMKTNLDLLLKRGESLEHIGEKSDKLLDSTTSFKKSTDNVKCAMNMKNIKYTICLIFVLLFLTILICFSIYIIIKYI